MQHRVDDAREVVRAVLGEHRAVGVRRLGLHVTLAVSNASVQHKGKETKYEDMENLCHATLHCIRYAMDEPHEGWTHQQHHSGKDMRN